MLHTYLSMVSFSILLFFAVTGITLNHQDRMLGAPRVARLSGQLAAETVAPAAGPALDRARIVGQLLAAHRLKGYVSDFRVDDDTVAVSFKGPGYAADAFIDRKTARYDLTETRMGLVAIVNDLHKGRDSGAVWKTVIDISAGLLTFISLTGLILLYYIHKHRLAGVILLVAGAALAGMLYMMGVP